MKKQRNRLGFTLLEMLIVVGIVGILAGVAFVGVQNHQRNMTRLEMDSVAKEIFVAAQNHLTMARTQNYLGLQPDTTTPGATSPFGTHGGYEMPGDTDAVYSDVKTGTSAVNNDVYYYIVNEGATTPSVPDIWEMMVPLGSVDETVRRGNYIIRYQPGSGRVLDVFYCAQTGRYSGTFDAGDYAALMALRDMNTVNPGENRGRRIRYTNDMVVGWYGGAEAVAIRSKDTAMLNPPEIEIINGDVLQVKVIDRNTPATGYRLQLIMNGLDTDKKQAANAPKLVLTLCDGTSIKDKTAAPGRLDHTTESSTTDPTTESSATDPTLITHIYTVTLDDITAANMRFAKFVVPTDSGLSSLVKTGGTGTWVNGQNISLQAEACYTDKLGNIARSNTEITNSLFADFSNVTGDDGTTKVPTASISSFRHLENLDPDISELGAAALGIQKAVQLTDLEWSQFMGGTKPSVYLATGESTNAGGYYPIQPNYALIYDGQSGDGQYETATDDSGKPTTKLSETLVNHSITGVTVEPSTVTDTAGIKHAGLFGTPTGKLTVQNLELIDFNIENISGNAGALAGSLPTGSKVENVLARNTDSDRTATISASGDAGGLIGTATDCTITRSAAALVVESTGGNAGGLIGSTSGTTTVTACYSGGHTIDLKDGDNIIGVGYDKTAFNVTASVVAGGLIGAAGDAEILNSYSTCSATGKSAGGFVGKSSGTISNCYATGLVKGTDTTTLENITINGKTVKLTISNDGAFACEATGSITNCKYFEIINERFRVTTGTNEYSDVAWEEGKKGEYVYLSPLMINTANPTGANTGIRALDADADEYEQFVGGPYDATIESVALRELDQQAIERENKRTGETLKATKHRKILWERAVPYDSVLKDYYKVADEFSDDTKKVTLVETRYNLKAVRNLDSSIEDSSIEDSEFVAVHYGDWPAPEIFVFNTAS